MLRRIGGPALKYTWQRPLIRTKLSVRKISTSAGPNGTEASAMALLGGLTVELDRIAPGFEVPASKIRILDSPSSFYRVLKVRRPPSCVPQNCVADRLVDNGRTKSGEPRDASTSPRSTLANPSLSSSRH
jgi:hypothetical protein